jgi:hypothetical protein
MKKLIILFILVISYITTANAQFTTVSATITDSDTTVWANARWQVVFVPNSSFPNTSSYTINGVKLTSNTYSSYLNQSGVSNGSGALSLTLLDNTAISPAGSRWRFTVQSNTAAPATSYTPVGVNGASESLTSFLSSNSKAPRFSAAMTAVAFGYADVEVSPTPPPGGFYFNVSIAIQRIWTGSAWVNNSGGVTGVLSLNSLTGNLNLLAGSNVTITPSGSGITIASTGGSSGVTSLNSLLGALSILAGTGISVTPSGSGITIANTGGTGMVYPLGDGIPQVVGGASWGTTLPLSTFALAVNNLSDLASASSARANLGLGTAAIVAAPQDTPAVSNECLVSYTASSGAFAQAVFGNLAGSLTAGTVPKATGAHALGDSLLTDDGTNLAYGGTGHFQIGSGAVIQWSGGTGPPPSGCGSSIANASIYLNNGGTTGSLMYICNYGASTWEVIY